MKRIKVTHFLQDPAHCAVASCAVAGNFYNSDIDYEFTKALAYKKVSKKIADEGLDSPQICMLLNHLGFNDVTLVTSDFSSIDFSWAKYGKRKMKEVLKESSLTKKDKLEKSLAKNLYKWYTKEGFNNNIKIDYNFGKYIRQQLNKKKPVILTFNWTMFFKFVKDGEKGGADPINGDSEEHAVVANGYDQNGVWIVDSHHQYYKYKRKKYRRGFYKISWENLMTVIGGGDVIIPNDYYIE
jgi:hypothetical protein